MPEPSENQAGASESSSGSSGAGQPSVSSGTASAALIAAAGAASSAESAPAAKPAGETAPPAGTGTPGTKPDAIGQPVGTVTQPATGEAPEARIQAAVRNARETAVRETEARYAAFKGMDPENVKLGLQVLTELRTDPNKFFKDLQSRLQPDVHVQPDEEYPAADLVSKDGQLKTYTDGTVKKMLDINAKKVIAQVMKELGPTINFATTEQGRREAAEKQTQRANAVKDALTEARTFPHFTKDNEPAILATLQSIPAERRQALGPVAALHMAYSMFLRDKVFPNSDADAEKRVRESFKRKAASGTGQAHPTDQGSERGEKAPLRNVNDLTRHMEKLAESLDAPG